MTQEKAQAMAEEKIRLEEELRDQRKNDSKEIAGETIRRELAESESLSCCCAVLCGFVLTKCRGSNGYPA